MSNAISNTQRVAFTDALRGLAICFMAIYHFWFDLSLYNLGNFSIHHPYWQAFRYIIISLFLGLVGWGLAQQGKCDVYWPRYWLRILKLAIAAFMISALSYYFAPTHWIYFGILHFILLASLLCMPLRFYPKTSLLLAVIITLLYQTTDSFNLSVIYTFLSDFLPASTLDLVRFIPWVSLVLLGIFLGHQTYFPPKLGAHPVNNTLAWMGRHSLSIYLLHQGPLLLMAYLINLALKP